MTGDAARSAAITQAALAVNAIVDEQFADETAALCVLETAIAIRLGARQPHPAADAGLLGAVCKSIASLTACARAGGFSQAQA